MTMIEMSDSSIPASLVENTELSSWPLDFHVVIDTHHTFFKSFLDEIDLSKLVRDSQNESLFRLKLTHIHQSDEWVMGTSWSPVLGDASVYAHFLSTFSRLQQQLLEPVEPLPVFERL